MASNVHANLQALGIEADFITNGETVTKTRYIVLGITILLFLFGLSIGLNLLDPYSSFGRIASNLFRPILIIINNVISYLWVKDVTNRTYAVPNYLTSRQLNVKLHFEF